MYLRLCDEMKTFGRVVQVGRTLVQPSPSNKTRLVFCSIPDCPAEALLVRGIREGCRLCCYTQQTRRRKFWAFVCRGLRALVFSAFANLRDISPTWMKCWCPPADGTGHMEAHYCYCLRRVGKSSTDILQIFHVLCYRRLENRPKALPL